MEHGKEILDLELRDRIDLHDLTAVCALRGLLRVLAGRFQRSITTLFPPLHGLPPCRAHGQTTLRWPTPRLLDIEIESGARGGAVVNSGIIGRRVRQNWLQRVAHGRACLIGQS